MSQQNSQDDFLDYSSCGLFEHEIAEVLTPAQVVKLMEIQLSKVTEFVDQPKNLLRCYLSTCKYDTDVFLEKFYEGRLNNTFKSCNEIALEAFDSDINNNEDKENGQAISQSTRSKKRKARSINNQVPLKKLRSSTSKIDEKPLKLSCRICFGDFSDVIALSCKNTVCKSCMKMYVTGAIYNSSSMDAIKCPGHECPGLLTDETVMKLLNSEMQIKFQQHITRSFIQNNRLIRWCISPKCTRALKVTAVEDQPAVFCKCGVRQCFSCGQEIHDLIPCKLVRDFNAKKAENIETAEYLAQFTKQCPKCHTEIEKNGGCNHMTCSVSKCRHEFCWICFGNWKTHKICNPPTSVSYGSDLRRLVQCNTKHASMIQSIKLDEKNYQSKIKLQDLESNKQWFRVDFIKKAIKILLRSRLSLADSCILSYFFMDSSNIQWIRFEMNLTNLMKSTEDLSHLLETQVNGDNFHEMKKKIDKASLYCEGQHRALFCHVKDGFAEGWWTTKAQSQ